MLLSGDPTGIEHTKRLITELKSVSDGEVFHLVKQGGCEWIRKQFSKDYYVSEKEKSFPLAFALTVFESPNQIFRFLKIIYRPHNVYCIHYDRASKDSFQEFITTVSNCLPNVIVPKRIVKVVWGWHTIVDAQFNCIDDLFGIRHKFPWEYVLTLCGKEVPLKTNLEIVDTLTRMNGTSAVDAFNNLDYEHSFWTNKYKVRKNSVFKTEEKLGPIPFGFTMKKSMAYYGLSVAFVNYTLHDNKAIEFRRFMADTFIPDEHFVATLFTTKGKSVS